ncbi:MAG TPA: DUF3553 domain-containing protein [Planctomycetaceae bacterium]|jgi:hypothetical protein|nr:DUF3553 domain-containing protein [Planctomycetaceae bacterium]
MSDEPKKPSGWAPERFAVGDIVVRVGRAKWGRGVVIEDSTRRRSPIVGQRLIVDFESRGKVMLFTAVTVIRRATADQ